MNINFPPNIFEIIEEYHFIIILFFLFTSSKILSIRLNLNIKNESKTIKNEVKSRINNLWLTIENGFVGKFFNEKYEELERLAPRVNWKKNDKDFVKRYQDIQIFYELFINSNDLRGNI